MYHTWYIRKAAVKLLIGLSVILAIVGSDIATDEKSAEASNRAGVSFRAAVNTESTVDSHQPEETTPDEERASKIFFKFRQPDTRVNTSLVEANPPQKLSYRLVIDVSPPQSSSEKDAVVALVQPDSQKVPEATAKILDSAPEASSTPETISSNRKSEEPQKMRALDDRPKPTMTTAQLQKTDPNAEKLGESAAQSREIIPLEIPPPIRRGPTGYTSRYFHIARPRLGLGLSYDFEKERRGDPNTVNKDTSNEFRQKLELEANGWIYHPALCKYRLRFDPEWTQVKRDSEPGETSTDTNFQPFYAIDAFFLEPKPYTLHGFAERREIKLRSAFTQVSDTTIDTYGGDLRLKYQVLPTFLKYTHTDTDQSGFFESTGKRDDFQLSSNHSTSNTTTNLTALYTDNEQTSGGATTGVKTFDANLGNEYNIAGDSRKRLLSSLSYRWSESDPSEGSSSEASFFQIRENFFWRHTPKMYTDYLVAYQNSDTDGFDRETTTFRAKLQHLLYENLTTTAEVGANLNDTTAGRENIYDANLNFLYQRKIPWGNITLSTDFDYTFTDRSGFDEVAVQVNNESHVLTTGVVTLLDNENVFPGTIVVTDVTGTIVYAENIDYTISQIDNFTRISRTTVGAIANGQTVLVDYRFRSDPTFDDAVFSQAYGIQLYLWNALTLGYAFRHAEQDTVSGTPPENPVDDTAHAAEIRLNLGWTDTRFTYEDIDRSSGISTTRWLASQTFRVRPVRRFLVDVTGSYGSTDIKDSGETQEQYGMSGRLFWTPAGWCRFRLEGFWNKITGDVEDSTDSNLTAGLEFSYRIWSGGIFYYFDNSEVDQVSRKRQAVTVEVIRILW